MNLPHTKIIKNNLNKEREKKKKILKIPKIFMRTLFIIALLSCAITLSVAIKARTSFSTQKACRPKSVYSTLPSQNIDDVFVFNRKWES